MNIKALHVFIKKYNYMKLKPSYLVYFRYMHLVGNLIFQLLLGLPLEIVHKWWRVLIVYFCGVIAGNCISASIISPFPTHKKSAADDFFKNWSVY